VIRRCESLRGFQHARRERLAGYRQILLGAAVTISNTPEFTSQRYNSAPSAMAEGMLHVATGVPDAVARRRCRVRGPISEPIATNTRSGPNGASRVLAGNRMTPVLCLPVLSATSCSTHRASDAR